MNNFIENCSKFGYNIDEAKMHNLQHYYELLVEWNEKMNLTAITKKEDVYEKHFLDSLCIANDIHGKVADVGSGAGFPGIVLAISRPDVEFTLIEPLQKRCLFLSHVKENLKLNNVTILNMRSEEIDEVEQFDFVTSRAVAKTNTLIELSFKFLKINGKALFLKANFDAIDEQNTKNALNIINGSMNFKVVEKPMIADARRCVVEITKLIPTDTKYPRSFNKIKKKPLGE